MDPSSLLKKCGKVPRLPVYSSHIGPSVKHPVHFHLCIHCHPKGGVIKQYISKLIHNNGECSELEIIEILRKSSYCKLGRYSNLLGQALKFLTVPKFQNRYEFLLIQHLIFVKCFEIFKVISHLIFHFMLTISPPSVEVINIFIKFFIKYFH